MFASSAKSATAIGAMVLFWFACASTTLADGHFGMMWTYQQFNDSINGGRMTTQLHVGVPETDHRMAMAACFAGSTAGLPRLELAADTFDLPEGAPIDVEFQAVAGPMVYRGEVKRPIHEEDYAGIRISMGFNDPLWNVLQQMNRITYRVNGQPIELPLRGSGRAISDFLADCRIYQGAQFAGNGGGLQPVQPISPPPAQPPAQPAAQPSDPRWASCDQLAGEVSRNSDTPVRVTFRNQSDGFRAVMWIGFDGIPQDYATLNPGEEFTIDTFLTHPWMFTDGPGNCIEMFMPQLGVPVFNISAPGRYFGPE